MTTTERKQREVLSEVMDLLDQLAQLGREVEDEGLSHEILAQAEGRGGGWLGKFLRDEVEEAYAREEDY